MKILQSMAILGAAVGLLLGTTMMQAQGVSHIGRTSGGMDGNTDGRSGGTMDSSQSGQIKLGESQAGQPQSGGGQSGQSQSGQSQSGQPPTSTTSSGPVLVGPAPSFGPPSLDDARGLRGHRVDEEMEKMQNNDRQKKLVADTARLLALATQLKVDMDKTNKDTLSLDVVRKAEEIEKLAHSVKERMKGV